MKTMKQWVLEGPRTLRPRTVEVPEPTQGQIRVALRWVGVCGTDVEFYRGEHDVAVLGSPVVLGHEPAGVVDATGDGVPPVFRPGTPVTFRYHYGCFAQYVCIDWHDAFILPPDIDLRDGTLVEVMPSVLNAINRLDISPQTSVVILGQGTSGLLLTAAAARRFPRCLVAADLLAEREALSMRAGASAFVTVEPGREAELLQATAGSFDAVIVACYSPTIAACSVDIAARWGRVMLYGGIGPARIDFFAAHRRRVDFLTAGLDDRAAERRLYHDAVQLLRDGIVDGSMLHTQTFPLDRLEEAFELRAAPRAEVVHVLIEVT